MKRKVMIFIILCLFMPISITQAKEKANEIEDFNIDISGLKENNGYVHLWKQDGTNVLYKIRKVDRGLLSGMWKIVDVKRKKVDRVPVPKTLLKEALIERLVDPIHTALQSHGHPRLWFRGSEKVLEIVKDEANFIFYVTVQVHTFEGPHNPPYGEETMTFKIQGNALEVVDFKHRRIPEEEWSKLRLQ